MDSNVAELIDITIKSTTKVNRSYIKPNEKEHNIIIPTETYDVLFYELKGRTDKVN